MKIFPPPGLSIDLPLVNQEPRWWSGYNIRFRLKHVETLGLFGPARGVSGAQVTLPGADKYRKIFTTPSTVTGQILVASTSQLRLLQFDPGSSTPGAPPRWAVFDVAPSPLTAIADFVSDPSAGRIEIPPVWWFADQDDVVVGCRANGPSEPCYAWDRSSATRFTPLANSPLGAVGGGIINRILVLIGCTSFSDPDPLRFMTIRWSDRFNFEEWTPSDINVSGELQLEGGSRIVGGGVTGFGVIAWTDRRMALLTETFDPDSVFDRRYVDGSRGLLANQAWAEADGVVWWLDEARVLNAFDGGRPRQIPNPLKAATIDRISDVEAARIYVQANPEYGEVLIWFPSGEDATNPDACCVYNYLEDAWTYWRLPRTAWVQRYGVIPALAVDAENRIWRHDLDVQMPSPWIDPDPLMTGGYPTATLLDVDDVEAFSFSIATNLLVTESPTEQSWRGTRLMIDHIPQPVAGAEGDVLDVRLTGYGTPTLTGETQMEEQIFEQGQAFADYRVGGKALQIRIAGTNQKTLWRLGIMDVAAAQGSNR